MHPPSPIPEEDVVAEADLVEATQMPQPSQPEPRKISEVLVECPGNVQTRKIMLFARLFKTVFF